MAGNKVLAYALTFALGVGGTGLYFKSKGDDYHWKHISEPGKNKLTEIYVPKLPTDTIDKMVMQYFPKLNENSRQGLMLSELQKLPEDKQVAIMQNYLDNMSYADKAKYFGKESWKATKNGLSWLYDQVKSVVKKEESGRK